jgi:hypothetical protein
MAKHATPVEGGITAEPARPRKAPADGERRHRHLLPDPSPEEDTLLRDALNGGQQRQPSTAASTAEDALSAAAGTETPATNALVVTASSQLVAPQAARVRLGEDGQPTRIRPGGDGQGIWAAAQSLVPDPATLSFVLASGNATKVWMALLIHAVRHGDELAAAVNAAEKLNAGKSKAAAPKPGSPNEQTSGLRAEWDNGSLSRATNLKNTAVHAAQNELIALGWLTKRPTRNQQGQFGGFTYVLHQPPTTLPDAAKKLYGKKVDSMFARAYEFQELLGGGEVVSGGCFSHSELLAHIAGKVDEGKKMVIEEHLRDCQKCRTTLAAIKDSEREWGA